MDCETCPEHSGVKARLNSGTWVAGIAATVLLAAFSGFAWQNRTTAATLADIREDLAAMRAAEPIRVELARALTANLENMRHRLERVEIRRE